MQSVKDTYQRITDTIIQQLEAGTKPWIRPWRGNVRRSATPLRASGEAYRGINVVMLWLSGQLAGYDENTWMTYRQAQELGAQVRKGEQGTLVVKYGTFTPKDQEADDRAVPYLKGYAVFNVEQIDNLPDRFKSPADDVPMDAVPVLENVESFIDRTGAKITYGGKQACYRPGLDDILIPDRGRFLSEIHLYSTVLHEISHWSGAKARLGRDLSGRFGSEAYAMEELVAEISAAFVCADLGIEHDPRDNTATYVENWLKVLKQDSRAVITAAAKAQAVADYLRTLNFSNSTDCHPRS